jgi:thioredoxin 1
MIMADKEMVRPVTDLSFNEDVIAAKRPVLVDFFAGWCGPCMAMAPILEDVAGDNAGRLDVVKLDVDANPETATRFGIRSLPTLLLFKSGQLVASQVGALPKARLKAWIDDAL